MPRLDAALVIGLLRTWPGRAGAGLVPSGTFLAPRSRDTAHGANDNWAPATKGDSFDPAVDRTIQPASFFPAQPANTFGNMTRYNPKFRAFPNLNENFSLAKSFVLHERVRMDLRAEMFNAFNRVRFGQGSLTIQSQTFGILSQTASDQANLPRQMQLALKLNF